MVIIVASFAVPLAKMFVLTWLLVSARTASPANALRRTRLYRVIDFIGRWSMVDIYVGGLLVALVQFHPFADGHGRARPRPLSPPSSCSRCSLRAASTRACCGMRRRSGAGRTVRHG